MRKVLIALAGMAITSQAGAATIANGDFSAGNTGFTSGYGYVDSSSTNVNALFNEGLYTVGTDAHLYHNSWTSFGDHTTGTGNYMIVNGATVGNVAVWTGDSVLVGPGTYALNLWLSSLYAGNPAELSITANGVVLGSDIFASATAGIWNSYTSGTFTVTVPTQVTFSILNQNTASGGNDFGLDDISLVQTGGAVPEPASWAMFIGGFGLVGGAARRRKATIRFA